MVIPVLVRWRQRIGQPMQPPWFWPYLLATSSPPRWKSLGSVRLLKLNTGAQPFLPLLLMRQTEPHLCMALQYGLSSSTLPSLLRAFSMSS